MNGKQIALYILSIIFLPVTLLMLTIGFFAVFPSLCKEKNASKKEEY